MIPRIPQVMTPADQPLLQYKSVTLEPNSQHEVYVSYITDGPCHFSVQLKKSEAVLAQLMREINSIPLKPFDELPIPGTVCLAKCMEDSHICRAVITSEVDNQYKLFYVDFGNIELVPPDNIYQMPFKYIIPKIMAVRLSLHGIDKSTVTLGMQCAFKQFVDNRLLMMEVYPSEKKMCLPKCRLWDPEKNIDVMDILNKAAQLAYPSAITLHRGFTRPVKVTFVHSCNKFYIHLKTNQDELDHLMANLQVYCNSSSATYLENPKIGLPCCAQFAFDGQWYRSSIQALNEDLAKVKYIDYGNEEDVPAQSLKNIEGQFITCMRPQAVECSLNGYQNMPEDIDRDNKLEELILDQEFTMKVIDTIDTKSLVDLIDSNGSTVTSLLMDAMINQTKVQVITNNGFENSPKTYGTGTSSRNQSKFNTDAGSSSRDKSHNRMDKSDDWRPNTRKMNGSYNDSTEPWRNTNNKNDTEWHDNASNESFSKGRKGNENRRSPSSTKGSNNNWTSPDQTEWNSKEANRGRNRRNDNESYSNKENSYNRNKNINSSEGWNTDNSTRPVGENEEFQGVKKKSRNFNGNNSNKSTADSEEWGNRKNKFTGNDYSEKKYSREKNSYDSDGSFKKGREDRNFHGKKYDDGGDYKKKPFRKENDFRKNDNEKAGGRKFNSRNESNWSDTNNKYSNNTYNASKTVADPAAEDATFQTLDVTGSQKVSLSWFHNPCSFFCQLLEYQESFSSMMEAIQEYYKDIPSSHCVKGAPAIALFPEDNVFYRSRILKNVDNKFKVYYVDFGNISIVDKVWPIDRKFMDLPMQAIPCGLGGIQSVENEWPDPTAFTKYMQKDYLYCEFLSFEFDRYMVNLSSDNQDIRTQLIQDNLAKVIEPSAQPIDFDINLLSGHTFRAFLQNVKDLSEFTMYLENGLELISSAHNLPNATELFEDNLKQKEGETLLVYCDNIIENRLEVTLYDHSGNKIQILNPDEGAFEYIEPVCPYLLIQSKVHGFVSHVNDTNIIVQPSDCSNKIVDLLNEMYEHYEAQPQETVEPEQDVLYAVCSADANWYRGRVTSLEDTKITIMYVDYGNSEVVPVSSLRQLDPKFYWWDRMAIMVHVTVPTADLFEKTVSVQVYYGELGLEGEILEVEQNAEPEGSKTEAIISEEFNNACQITGSPQDTQNYEESSFNTSVLIPNEHTSSPNEVKPVEIPSEQNVESTAVILSHIDSPCDFYIQLADSQNAIRELQAKLQEQIEEMPVLENTTVGGLCAAPYSVDQMWYRSQILDADEDITTVRFIDYGNTDVIDNKATQIKTLPAELLALEEYATRCRLKIKPLEEEWSKMTMDRFEQLVYAENVRVQFINQDEKANYVELLSEGQNVKDILIRENLALIDEDLVLDPKLKGYISHMNSPSEFWVQLDGWCAELEWIAEQLSSAASFPDLEDFTPGSLCAAMFPDDEMWYRARILSNTVAGLEVLFLDYGNSCVCGNLKQLPEHLVMASPLALKCSLQKPEGLLNWSAEAAQKFSDLSADGQTEFRVKKLTTGETSIVELYLNDEAVSSKLLPITESGYITDLKSLGSFSLSKEGVVSDERYGLEKIPGYDYNQEALEKFVEINNEGKTCFGVEHTSDGHVRLYINGNDIRLEILPLLKTNSQKESSEICHSLLTETINQAVGEVEPEEHQATECSPCNNDEISENGGRTPNESLVVSQSLVADIIEQATTEHGDNDAQKSEVSPRIESDLNDGTPEVASEIEISQENEPVLSEEAVSCDDFTGLQEEQTDEMNHNPEERGLKSDDIIDIQNGKGTHEELSIVENSMESKEAYIESDSHDIAMELSQEIKVSQEEINNSAIENNLETEEALSIQNEKRDNSLMGEDSPLDEGLKPNMICDNQDEKSIVGGSQESKEVNQESGFHDIKLGISMVSEISNKEENTSAMRDNLESEVCDIDNSKHDAVNKNNDETEENILEKTSDKSCISPRKEICDRIVETEYAIENHTTTIKGNDQDTTKNEETGPTTTDNPSSCDENCEEQQKEFAEPLNTNEEMLESNDITNSNSPTTEPKKSQKTTSQIEFTETMMTSFSAPTVSENESLKKISPTKVAPKLHENSEVSIDDSCKLEE